MYRKLLQLIKKLVANHYKKLDKKYFIDLVNKQISASNEPCSPLSDSDISAIISYWNQFGIKVPLNWHRLLYGKCGTKYVEFVPRHTFYRQICPCMNDDVLSKAWGDKAYFDCILNNSGVKVPTTILRYIDGRLFDNQFCLIDASQADKILQQNLPFVIKPSLDSGRGKGVKRVEVAKTISDYINEYAEDFIVQLPITQHETMGALNSSSVNTIRVSTVMLDNQVYVMSAFVKVGAPGCFADNQGEDRFFIGIDVDGRFLSYAIDKQLNKHNSIVSGYNFQGKDVPSYDLICKVVKRAHQCFSHFGFVFWDVAIDEEGTPVLIEANLQWPDTTIAQMACGSPFMGKYTTEVMNYIYNRKLDAMIK